MDEPDDMVEHDDIQALARFGHGQLKDSRFLLLSILDRRAAGRWLKQASISSATSQQTLPDTAMQIAFTPAGLRTLGLAAETLAQFSEEFLTGVSGDDSRSRRLGDVEHNAPERWNWGHADRDAIHILLLLYAREGGIDDCLASVVTADFEQAFNVLHSLPTDTLQPTEPFGFVDGISQPAIDWKQNQRTDVHAREAYSNLLAPGEIVLGYSNEYGQLTRRPLISTDSDALSSTLPEAADVAGHQDFGRNGSYLVLRQLEQNVDAFWRFLHQQVSGDADAAEQLAALMVGRHRNGESLVPPAGRQIPGIPASHAHNHFDFASDPDGLQCPVGAHVRRSNPRTGDFPPGVNNLWSRLVRMLGFKRRSEYEDLVASSRYHRLLRRGRTYGLHGPSAQALHAESDVTQPDTAPRGLQFICLAGNILRQFEFIQSAWSISSSFAGTHEQRDPLLGHRQSLLNGHPTDSFMYADERGAAHRISALPDFVTVRGAGYFFMPGLRAIAYLSALAAQEDVA